MGVRCGANGANVTVSGLRIKSEMLDPAFFGAIHCEGGAITVTDSIFTPSTVTGTGTITQSGNQTNAEYEA
jgi:hypothetical protein